MDEITFTGSCPLLVQVGTSDSICPPQAGRRAVPKAGARAELREYPVDHVDVKGSPFVCHQGELLLRPHGDGTAVTWKIRFRPRIPGTGRLIAARFSRALNRMMTTRLRRHVEHLARQEDAIA